MGNMFSTVSCNSRKYAIFSPKLIIVSASHKTSFKRHGSPQKLYKGEQIFFKPINRLKSLQFPWLTVAMFFLSLWPVLRKQTEVSFSSFSKNFHFSKQFQKKCIINYCANLAINLLNDR